MRDLDILQEIPRILTFACHAIMRSLTANASLSFVFSVAALFGEEAKEVVPTTNKFSKQLSEFVQNALAFTERNGTLRIEAKSESTLPLEFVAGKGLEASDGILSAGDSFAWPGCGFDRTSYTIKGITRQDVVIEYSRGMPQRDGYQDSGEFRINLGIDK